MRTRSLWLAAFALLAIGVALVFGAVLVRGLFIPGIVLLDAGLLGLVAAALLGARKPTPPPH